MSIIASAWGGGPIRYTIEGKPVDSSIATVLTESGVYVPTVEELLAQEQPVVYLNQPKDFKIIPLTRNFFALVDNEFYSVLSKESWQARTNPSKYKLQQTYAFCSSKVGDKWKNESMHRAVFKLAGYNIEKTTVDHINHSNSFKLDNRMSNMRLASYSENNANRRTPTNKKHSKYKNVSYHNKRKKFYPLIVYHSICIHLGSFDTETEAVIRGDIAAKLLYGEFALTNGFEHLATPVIVDNVKHRIKAALKRYSIEVSL